MKHSIIIKTLIILSIVIGFIFIASSYLFSQNDTILIEKIRKYNLESSMKALDQRLNEHLSINKKQMENTASMLAKNSSLFLLNYDIDGLKKSLQFDMKDNGIKAVKVFDTTVNENFLISFKLSNKILFDDIIPKDFNNFKIIKRDINFQNENYLNKIGYLELYYDESIIVDKINNIKENTKLEINRFNQEIDQQKESSDHIKLLINLGALIVILLLIYILLMYFVNRPLHIVQSGLDNFFMFLQNKRDRIEKIELNSEDEFGHMAKSLNENISVSAKLHEEINELNTNLEKKVEEKTTKVTTLLDNAGQGFLTFDKNFIVDDEYSKECEKLIKKSIANKDITSLIFTNAKKIEIFKESLTNAINEKIAIKRNAYLSLLPSIILLNKKAIKLEYKILDSNKFMLILTNITSQKKLEKKVKQEQEILKMIVSVVSDSELFYETKKEYEEFIKDLDKSIDENATALHNITKLYRVIHTFKGTFSQLYIQEVVSFLHSVESELSNMQKNICESNSEIKEFLNSCEFEKSYNKSLNIIEEILGEEFLTSSSYLKIDIHDISNLQEKIEKIFNNLEQTTPECQDILCSIQNIANTKLISLLQPYSTLTKQLATRLEKDIYELKIVGNKNITINDNIKPFIKSLTHLFRNSIDHGIESPEKRASLNKDESGTISCNYNVTNNRLHIIISDDGAGINKDKIVEKLKSKNIDTTKLKDSEIYNYIFSDNFSTKDSLSDISGRGVGMSALKEQIDKLNGKINITSTKNIGTTFEFIVPLEN